MKEWMEMHAINERFALNEEKTQRELLELRTENLQLKEDLANTKDDLANTKEDLLIKEQELEKDVSFLKNPPFFHACGAHYGSRSITRQTIPYSRLLYSSAYSPDSVSGGLDISTGIMTCGWPGSYNVTWSLSADDDHGDRTVYIYLRKNGQRMDESLHQSWYTGSSGTVYDQGKQIHNIIILITILCITGGRTLVLHLDRGDTVDLYCEDCSAGIYLPTFCVSLSTFDIL